MDLRLTEFNRHRINRFLELQLLSSPANMNWIQNNSSDDNRNPESRRYCDVIDHIYDESKHKPKNRGALFSVYVHKNDLAEASLIKNVWVYYKKQTLRNYRIMKKSEFDAPALWKIRPEVITPLKVPIAEFVCFQARHVEPGSFSITSHTKYLELVHNDSNFEEIAKNIERSDSNNSFPKYVSINAFFVQAVMQNDEDCSQSMEQ